eukprot:2026791-Rhodomonas_salina.1
MRPIGVSKLPTAALVYGATRFLGCWWESCLEECFFFWTGGKREERPVQNTILAARFYTQIV